MFTKVYIGVLVAAVLNAFTTASWAPPYAWDSHIHVIDPEHFPLSPSRDYTPKPATKYNASAFFKETGIAHPVIVLPSVYGTDNAALLDALNYFNGTARGVAVVDPKNVTNATLQELHEAGVRGLRVNVENGGSSDGVVAAVNQTAPIAKMMGWALELYTDLSDLVALHPIIPTLGVRVVVDHFGHTLVGSMSHNPLDTIDPYIEPGFAEMLDLVRRRLLFVKVSGPYRDSNKAPLYDDMRVVAQTIMINGPEMVVFGSDWPPPPAAERLVPLDYQNVNDLAIIAEFKEWAGSDAQVQRLFVDNPRRLWQWEDPDA